MTPRWLAAIATGAGFLVAASFLGIRTLNGLAAPYLEGEVRGIVPTQYKKSAHTRQTVSVIDGSYRFEYGFRDPKGHDWIWNWSYGQGWTDTEIGRYGVPRSIFEPYEPTRVVLQRRDAVIGAGLYMNRGRYTIPDYNAMVGHYMAFTEPLHRLLEEMVRGKGFQSKVELLLKFVQDIPYGVPPDGVGDRIISGLLPPPQVLVEAFGDCDSKAVLFASVLAHDPRAQVVFLTVPNHLLVAVESVPRPFQSSVEYRGRRYVLAEPVGPARYDFGSAGEDSYVRFQEVIEIDPSPTTFDAAVATAGSSVSARPDRTQKRLFVVGRKEDGSRLTETYRDQRGKRVRLVSVDRRDGNVTMDLVGHRTLALLARVIREDGKELEDAAFVQQQDGRYQVTATVSDPGEYVVRIFARDPAVERTYPHMFDYDFTSEHRSTGDPGFPVAYGLFAERGAFLETPMRRRLRPGTTAAFELRVPNAQKVAVIVGDEWTFLQKRGDWFEGAVTLVGGSRAAVATLVDGERYGWLLEYEVM